jgi:hypothetical protein
MEALNKAEAIDSYLAKCKASEINMRARARCTYLPFRDTDSSSFSRHALPGETIVTMNPSADGGMPHTRPPATICLPAYFPERRLEEVLRHERVHLDQRKNLYKWSSLLEKDGWTPVEEEKIPEEHRRRCRINPDTCWSPYWAWQKRYVPLPFFVREDKPDLADISVRWYDLDEEIISSVTPFSLKAKYGDLSPSSLEHPFELAAYSEQ